MRTKFSLLITLLFFSLSLQAQQSRRDSIAQTTLITDRPDATESPNTVPAGFWQYEGGFLYSKDKAGTSGIEKPFIIQVYLELASWTI